MIGFARIAWTVLAYNVGVILWGAYVRASGSGAGCGRHWPLCNGEVVPLASATKTWVEYSHRISSGIALIAVLWLAIWATWRMPRHLLSRRFARLSAIFMLFEAAIGAGLVLLRLVEQDASVLRAFSTILHLVNTFLLLTTLTLTAAYARGLREVPRTEWSRTGLRGWKGVLTGVGFALVCLVGASGAIAALGDTLFPAVSLAQGFRADLAPSSHFLLKLRTIHPMIALTTAMVLLGLSRAALSADRHIHGVRQPAEATLRVWATALFGSVSMQVIFGFVNLALLAPIWSQLVHLFLADLVVISFAGFAGAWLAVDRAEFAGAAR